MAESTPKTAPKATQTKATEAPQTEAPVVQETAASTPAPAPEPVAPVAESTQEKQTVSAFEAKIADLKKTGTEAQKAVIATIERYMENMSVIRPTTPTEGAMYQGQLAWLLNNVTHRYGADFKPAWSLILEYFNEYKDGVFGERHVYRFFEQSNMGAQQIEAFQRLVNLIILTANPKTRKESLKQVDIERTLAVGFDETARQNLLAFYGQ